MKKLISSILMFAFAVLPALSVNGQKSRSVRAIPAVSTETGFANIGAFSSPDGILVRWTMKLESNNLGFSIYRVDSQSERLVSPDIILGAAIKYKAEAVPGESYEFFDRNADADAVYIVEAISTTGRRIRSSGVVPTRVDGLRNSGGVLIDGLSKADPEGKNLVSRSLDLPKDLSNEVISSTTAPDPVTHRTVISRPGVKIGVKGEGMFRASRAELQAAGFDVNSDSNLWQLYVNGIEQSINIGPNGDWIEFLGRGVDQVETDVQTYFLVTGDNPGKRIQNRAIRLGSSTVVSRSFAETFVKKERTDYLSQVFNGEAENYFGRAITASPTTLPFTLTGVDFTSSSATLLISILGYSFNGHQVEMILNGNVLPPASSFGRQLFSTTLTVPTAWLVEGNNSLQFRSVGPAGDISFFDRLQVSFSRRYVSDQNTLRFFTPNYKAANLEGFSSANIRVFDVTDENAPVQSTNLPVVQNGATFGVTIPAGRGRLFYAVEDSALKSVHSITANDPSMLSSPSNAGQLVIISHKSFLNQADAWANYRRSQGITVKVIEVSEIYDEYNFGGLSANSIRAFLLDASATWQTPPEYVLLVGDASFDSRNYEGTGYFNMVPTKFVTTIFLETGSDDALADFNNDGLAEIAIGRIPVRNAQSAADILTRQIAWEAGVSSPLSRGVLFAFDLPTTYDFEGMSNRIKNQLPAGTPSTLVGRGSPSAQTNLLAAMNTGKYLVNYAGHGTTGSWVASSFFAVSIVPQLTNANSRSIYTMLTCLNGYFMNLTNDSLAEALLKAPNGGAVAAWASTGETTPDVQEIMALRFYNQIGSGPANLNRMGDLIKDAKAQIPGGGDVRLSWALIGDPMLKVR